MAPARKRAKAPVAPAAPAKKVEEKKEETVVKAAEEVKVVETKPAAKETEKKAPAKKTAAKKSETKAAETKTAAKKETKTTAKKALEAAFVLQFQGREVTKDQLEERFKEVWTKDLGKKYTEVKKVAFYIKPEESAVYFVVNDSDEGSFGI